MNHGLLLWSSIGLFEAENDELELARRYLDELPEEEVVSLFTADRNRFCHAEAVALVQVAQEWRRQSDPRDFWHGHPSYCPRHCAGAHNCLCLCHGDFVEYARTHANCPDTDECSLEGR